MQTLQSIIIWLSEIEVHSDFYHPSSSNPVFFLPVEAGKPHAVSLWALGHAVEMATAGGPGGGGVSDWGGG